MTGIGRWTSERIGEISAAEHGLMWAVFAVVAVALTAGTYWYMRREMPGSGPDAGGDAITSDEGQARRARTAPRDSRKWRYRTDVAGRPRRFLSHREAAWWAALTAGKFASPLLLYASLMAFVHSAGPGLALAERAAPFSVVAMLVAFWLAGSGVLYLFVTLSGGVAGRDERRRDPPTRG